VSRCAILKVSHDELSLVFASRGCGEGWLVPCASSPGIGSDKPVANHLEGFDGIGVQQRVV
jgi:hypothetical protein